MLTAISRVSVSVDLEARHRIEGTVCFIPISRIPAKNSPSARVLPDGWKAAGLNGGAIDFEVMSPPSSKLGQLRAVALWPCAFPQRSKAHRQPASAMIVLCSGRP